MVNKTQSKFSGECDVCSKVGHKAKDCWYNEENTSKKREEKLKNGNKYNSHEPKFSHYDDKKYE